MKTRLFIVILNMITTSTSCMLQENIEIRIRALGKELIKVSDPTLNQTDFDQQKTSIIFPMVKSILIGTPDQSALFLIFANTRGYFKRTALILATTFGYQSLVATLINEAKAYLEPARFDLFINAHDSSGKTALDIATFYASDSSNLNALDGQNQRLTRIIKLKRQGILDMLKDAIEWNNRRR